MLYSKCRAAFMFVVGMLLSGGVIFGFTNSVYAENGTASDTTTVTLNLTSAISIRTLDSTAASEIEALNLELTPTPSGRFVKDTSIIDVATSNATGYTLYMTSSYTNPHIGTEELPADTPTYTTDLIHNDSNVASSYSIPTIDPTLGGTVSSDIISEAEFSAPNTTSSGINSNPHVNHWGYSITEKDVAGTYSPIPAHNTSDTVNDTITTAMEHSYTPVTIGVNVDTNIASGTYTNELTFTAIANALPTTFTVNFNSNTDGAGGETVAVTDKPSNLVESTVAAQYTFTLPSGSANIPAKSGMVLKEWNTKPDGTGTSYQPGDEFTIVADNSLMDPGARTLYAIWTADFFNITYMQDMYPTVCTKVTTPATSATDSSKVDTTGAHAGDTSYVAQRTLSDIRDSNSYTVRKLADGNCWMTQNLTLALSAGTPVVAASNTSRDTISFTPTSCSTNGVCSMNGNTVAGNGTRYYSWYAATAETGTSSDVSVDTPTSICPVGWRLPYNYTIDSSTTSRSYSNLTKAYLNITTDTSTNSGYQTLEAFPLNFARSGYVASGAFDNNGSGNYWSSTAYSSATGAYSLHYNTTNVYPQVHGHKYRGFNVRCVAL